jgi:hypothetical protein
VPGLAELDRGGLQQAVGRAVGREPIDLVEWRYESLGRAFNSSTAGVYRFAGTGRHRGEIIPWSVILKLVQVSDGPFGGSALPLHANYWKREALIYQSGLLDSLPGIRAPRCYGIDEPDSANARIWLEDLDDQLDSSWPSARHRVAAHQLGAFNGAYLTGWPLPTTRCLSQGWVSAILDTFVPAFAQLARQPNQPFVRRCWPGAMVDRLMRLWGERPMLLEALDRLPQTFSHLDAFDRNLRIDPSTGKVAVLDWSYAGIAAVGSELAATVAASVCLGDAEPDQLPQLDQLAFDEYLAGLASAGWTGDISAVRLGYTATVALRYGLFPMGIFLVDGPQRTRFERLFGRAAIDIADRWARIASFLLDRADEARQLLART